MGKNSTKESLNERFTRYMKNAADIKPIRREKDPYPEKPKEVSKASKELLKQFDKKHGHGDKLEVDKRKSTREKSRRSRSRSRSPRDRDNSKRRDRDRRREIEDDEEYDMRRKKRGDQRYRDEYEEDRRADRDRSRRDRSRDRSLDRSRDRYRSSRNLDDDRRKPKEEQNSREDRYHRKERKRTQTPSSDYENSDDEGSSNEMSTKINKLSIQSHQKPSASSNVRDRLKLPIEKRLDMPKSRNSSDKNNNSNQGIKARLDLKTNAKSRIGGAIGMKMSGRLTVPVRNRVDLSARKEIRNRIPVAARVSSKPSSRVAKPMGRPIKSVNKGK